MYTRKCAHRHITQKKRNTFDPNELPTKRYGTIAVCGGLHPTLFNIYSRFSPIAFTFFHFPSHKCLLYLCVCALFCSIFHRIRNACLTVVFVFLESLNRCGGLFGMSPYLCLIFPLSPSRFIFVYTTLNGLYVCVLRIFFFGNFVINTRWRR